MKLPPLLLLLFLPPQPNSKKIYSPGAKRCIFLALPPFLCANESIALWRYFSEKRRLGVFLRQKKKKGLAASFAAAPFPFAIFLFFFLPRAQRGRAVAPCQHGFRRGGRGAGCSPSPSFQRRSPARWRSRDALSNKNHGDRPRRRKKVFLYSLNEAISIFYVSAPQCVCVRVLFPFVRLFLTLPPRSAGAAAAF